MATITTKHEHARGCGFRKQGGKYMISDGVAVACFKLPIPLTYCPCCGAGIKFTRGFQWIGKEIPEAAKCTKAGCKGCVPFDGSVDKFGLMWVGERYYSPSSFIQEAASRGVSKRITAIPKGFELGSTWILLAHKKAVFNEEKKEMDAGIFYCFRPTAMEYVVKGTETEEELEAIEKQGFDLIEVIPVDTREMNFDSIDDVTPQTEPDEEKIDE